MLGKLVGLLGRVLGTRSVPLPREIEELRRYQAELLAQLQALEAGGERQEWKTRRSPNS